MRRLTARQLHDFYDEARERMLSSERLEWLNARITRQICFAYKHSAVVRKKLDEASVFPRHIQGVRDLERIPLTEKDELIEIQRTAAPFGGFAALSPLDGLRRVFILPGPLYDVWANERVGGIVRGFVRLGLPKRGDVVAVWDTREMVPSGALLTDALDMIGCTVVPMSTGNMELQVESLRDLKVTAIFNVPSITIDVLKTAESMGYDVKRDLSLKCTIGGGERRTQDLRRVFGEKYGLVFIDNLCVPELGILAYDCGLGLGFHYEDEDYLIEIVDPLTGKQLGPFQEGKIAVTSFSRNYPLVRYCTDESASYTDEVCICGRTSPRLINTSTSLSLNPLWNT